MPTFAAVSPPSRRTHTPRITGDGVHAFSHRRTNAKLFALIAADAVAGQKVLDVGAGEGFFSRLLGEHLKARGVTPAAVLRACDLYPEQFRYPEVPCDGVDAAMQLPYPDAAFDIACSIEVVEHLEDQFHLVRELHRILRAGGRAFVTTPNLLNINSRLRFLRTGFWLLFDPLPLGTHNPVHLAGHVHPITFYYLAYLFHRAGFAEVVVHFDRFKKSGTALTIALSPLLALGWLGFVLRLRRKMPAVYVENRPLLSRINSWQMLRARTVIVEGIKARAI
jgi:SAM-dependent methyltransferase